MDATKSSRLTGSETGSEAVTILPPLERFESRPETMALLRVLSELAPGEELSQDEVALRAGLRPEYLREHIHWLYRVTYKLRKNGIHVRSRGRMVKRLLSPESIEDACAGVKRVHRQCRSELEKIACADFDQLTAEQRLQASVAATILSALHRASAPRSRRQIETAVAKTGERLPPEVCLRIVGEDKARGRRFRLEAGDGRLEAGEDKRHLSSDSGLKPPASSLKPPAS